LHCRVLRGVTLKAYTGTGDKGETGLYGGTRVGKENPRVEAYGAVDELNSQIGVARALIKDKKLSETLKQVQEDLFVLGGDLASELVNAKIPRIGKLQLDRLEKVTDESNSALPRLRRFILPGGSLAGAELHVARAVCRRAERRIVALSKSESINPEVLPYINRLSSFLFVLAREMNRMDRVPDVEWLSHREEL
jgi:cob(I)alamin adenosyltransferase